MTATVEWMRAESGPWELRPHRKAVDGWARLEIMALRIFAGLRHEEIAKRARVSPAASSRAARQHAALCTEDAAYATRLAELGWGAGRLCLGLRM